MVNPRFYGQWDPPVDKVLYMNYFYEIKDGFFVDCGAAEGVLYSCTKFFEDSLDWKGVCIEPSPKAFAPLQTNRKATNLNLGLSNKDGNVIFTEAFKPGNSGGAIDYLPKLKNWVAGFGYSFLDIQVDVITYRSLIERLGINKVDLMIIDVEGHEMQVIEGMVGTSVLPKVICIEYTITGMNRITKALSGLGYHFDFISFNNAFLSTGFPEKEWFGITEQLACYQDG